MGKIGIPDAVLMKVTPFTTDDWAVMKGHSAKSQRIILAAGLDDGDLIGGHPRHGADHCAG